MCVMNDFNNYLVTVEWPGAVSAVVIAKFSLLSDDDSRSSGAGERE